MALVFALAACADKPPTPAPGKLLPPTARDKDGRVVLTLTGRAWPPAAYAEFREHPDVQVVQMANEDVTDAQLEALKDLPALEEVDLNLTAVSDKGMALLAGLPKLKTLHLRNTKVTDEGLEKLIASASLEKLDLRGTAVTPAAAEKWKASKPGRTLQ
jgi:hypothetical protein